jgi:hypothetical protein
MTARVALVLALFAAAMQTARAEPCAPRAELGGDAEAISAVAAELARLGVDASTDPLSRPPRGNCPVIVAAVELDRSGGIAVAVRDGSQRSEGRVVSDAVLAAAWIDSWLRDDFTAPLPEAPPAAAPPSVVAAAPVATPVLDRFSLAASFVQLWSDDSTSWSGVGGSLCVRVGDFCLGARVSYAQQTVNTELSAAAKQDLALLATASYPQFVGRMSIAPELGLGVGRLATKRVEGCKMDPVCDPMTDPTNCTMPAEPSTCDPNTPGTVYVGDNLSTATITPRISAGLRIAIPLFEHVWLDGLAAATLAPFGHTADYGEKAADGTTMNLAYPLPGDPPLGVQLAIGLRLGAP